MEADIEYFTRALMIPCCRATSTFSSRNSIFQPPGSSAVLTRESSHGRTARISSANVNVSDGRMLGHRVRMIRRTITNDEKSSFWAKRESIMVPPLTVSVKTNLAGRLMAGIGCVGLARLFDHLIGLE